MPAAAKSALPTLIERFKREYPDAKYELNWDNPFQLVIATILAAQCTDARVNQATPALFARFPDARALAAADQEELEGLVRTTGFYRQKAKSIKACARALADNFGGEVPRTVEEMTTLPGVARKTANVVLTTAYRLPSGVVVDTHVARVSRRLGLTGHDDPDRIEQDLMALVPKSEWVHFGAAMVLHGRYTCTARAPKCGTCLFTDLCPKVGVDDAAAAGEDDGDGPPAGSRVALGALSVPLPVPKPKAKPAPVPSVSTGEAMNVKLPQSWQAVLADELKAPYFKELTAFVDAERKQHKVFPPENEVFSAFQATPYDQVKVLLLGQDPYHDDGQAHGMCFSVRPGVRPPPSLVNIFKELRDDLGCTIPNHGYLMHWAEQGVMLLNAVLTVRAHQPNSHKDKGWEKLTDAVIRDLNGRDRPVVFLFWGAYAQKKTKLIDEGKHPVVMGAHPSPLSAKKFFGSRPFSKVNKALEEVGQKPIDWQIPNL